MKERILGLWLTVSLFMITLFVPTLAWAGYIDKVRFIERVMLIGGISLVAIIILILVIVRARKKKAKYREIMNSDE